METAVSVNGGAMRVHSLWRVLTDPNEDACLKLTFSGSWSWRTLDARKVTCWR